MQLNVFHSNSGLPSLDLKSLQMMAYASFMKMKNVNVVQKTFKPYIGQLPELVCEKGSITDLEEFVEYLKFEAGSNTSLNDDELLKVDKRFKPYEVLFQETLKPALLNTVWLDEKNYAEKTRGLYAEISGFPLSILVPGYLRKFAIDYMDSVYPVRTRETFFDAKLITKARTVLVLLSNELKDSKYFSGSSTPNEVDALIFGYLAIMMKLQLPTVNNLHQLFERNAGVNLSNLVLYVNRILNEYFPEQERLNREQAIKEKTRDTTDLERTTWKSIALVGLVAVASNVLYALYVLADDDDDESDDEDD